MKRILSAAGMAVLLLTVCLPLLLPAGALPAWGEQLRALSLSGPAGNAAAWAAVLVFTALPALGLFQRPRRGWDLLLLLAAGEIFAGLYLLVNPTLISTEYPAAPAAALAMAGSLSATVLAWAVLRWLADAENTPSLGRTLERLLQGAAVLVGLLSAWSAGAAALEKIHAAAQANTVPGAVLWPTNVVIALLAAAGCVPTLLVCGILAGGARLASALEADPFGQDTLALAERVSRGCRRTAAAAVLLCAGGNLLQFMLLPVLRDMHFQVSFPLTAVLLAVALDLLCRYFQRAKAVSDDNESII